VPQAIEGFAQRGVLPAGGLFARQEEREPLVGAGRAGDGGRGAVHPVQAVFLPDGKAGGFQHFDVAVEVAQAPVVLLGQRLQRDASPGLHQRALQYFQSDRAIVPGHCYAALYRRSER
jgi:hypothetical protein